MVDWRSREVEAVCLEVYVRLEAFILGVFLYWVCLTLRTVEIPLLSRTLAFSYPYIPYLLGRAGGVAGAVLIIIISLEDYGPFCERLLPLMPVVAAIVVTCSSTNIALRPLTLFRRSYYALCVLLLLSIVHWLMAIVGIIFVLKGKPDPSRISPTGACVAARSAGYERNNMVILFYVYTMLWDITILIFTIIGLVIRLPAQASPLWRGLYSQGVAYVVATILLNIPMLIFTSLDLNATMNTMFAAPGAIISIMASSAAVISIMKTKMTRPGRQRNSPQRFAIELQPISHQSAGPSEGLFTSHIDAPSPCILPIHDCSR
ncbi:hypothetical protein BXZ70DRAFT_945062 [Cristinia sonorae]|uniref:Uncharacterized protein n=1 Tax=Cristinia sonorae TaxID=1940300 RepID=A0A8K0ULR2_9AGAR|nr:hypothetical protein BXZ70DRAFT_945062 [Cristinia sonorae]